MSGVSNRARRVLASGVLAAAVACATQGCATTYPDISYASETSPRANLKGYQTYAWLAEAAVVNDPNNQWSPPDLDVGSEIRSLVDRELSGSGMRKVTGDPDVLAFYAVGVDMESLEVIKQDENSVEFENVPRGSLLIVLVDPQSMSAVWAGAADAKIQDNPEPELVKDRLDYAIRGIFKGFRK